MSPESSDSARGSSCFRWDLIDPSSTSFNAKSDEDAIADRETASRAVAFVVQNSREGIVHLSAEVANLMKAKARLGMLVQSLQKENADLKKIQCVHELADHSHPCSSDSGHFPYELTQERSPRCTKLGPVSPRSHPSTLSYNDENVSAMDHLLSADSFHLNLPGGTKKRSQRCTRKLASSSLSYSTEEIQWVPSSPSTRNSTLSSSSLNSGGSKKKSLWYTNELNIRPDDNKLPSSSHESSNHPELSDETAVNQGYSRISRKQRLSRKSSPLPKEAEAKVPHNDSGDVVSGHCGSLHTVRVEVHRTSHDQVPRSSEEEPTMLKSVAVGTNSCPMESVGVQCSIGQSAISILESAVKRAEKEKADLAIENSKLQEEMRKLNGDIDQLKVSQEVHEKYTKGQSNCRTEKRDQTFRYDTGLPHSLPSITAQDEGIPVKSLKKVTARCTFHLGDRVQTKTSSRGRVHYIGTLKHLNSSSALMAGIHLEDSVGSHGGFLEGYRYFRCPKNHGTFVPAQDVLKVLSSKFTKKPRSARLSLNKVSPYNVSQKIVPSSENLR